MVLQKLRKDDQFHANCNKSELWWDQVSFLGRVIIDGGMCAMD
jgi:hypothetical protein